MGAQGAHPPGRWSPGWPWGVGVGAGTALSLVCCSRRSQGLRVPFSVQRSAGILDTLLPRLGLSVPICGMGLVSLPSGGRGPPPARRRGCPVVTGCPDRWLLQRLGLDMGQISGPGVRAQGPHGGPS